MTIPLTAGPRNSTATPKKGLTLIEFLVVLGIVVVLVALFLPAPRRSRQAGRRAQCKNNLKQIGIALHNYHDTYHEFPPAYTVDANGRPLHSWRTLLLPFLDQNPLYEKIDLSKPWNDPVNEEAFKSFISTYSCPSKTGERTTTTYLAVVTSNSCLRPKASAKLSDVTDGSSETIAVIEVDPDMAVHWMEPIDAGESQVLAIGSKTKHDHIGGAHTLFLDGTVRFLSENLPASTRLALISISAKDTVGEF
jgi:prepilin-type N-terminal cleavage/methylation domain-containing protein